MKITNARQSSRISAFTSILLAPVLVAGCTPKATTSTVDVPQGNTMAQDIQNGASPTRVSFPHLSWTERALT